MCKDQAGWAIVRWGLVLEKAVMLQKGPAIRAVHERHVQVAGMLQRIGVVEALLHAAAQRLRPLLRLNDGEGNVGFVEQQIVYLFLAAAPVLAAGPSRHNAAVREGVLLPDSVCGPARTFYRGRDMSGAGFLLGSFRTAHRREEEVRT
jgi:hypothetical protein